MPYGWCGVILEETTPILLIMPAKCPPRHNRTTIFPFNMSPVCFLIWFYIACKCSYSIIPVPSIRRRGNALWMRNVSGICVRDIYLLDSWSYFQKHNCFNELNWHFMNQYQQNVQKIELLKTKAPIDTKAELNACSIFQPVCRVLWWMHLAPMASNTFVTYNQSLWSSVCLLVCFRV